MANIEAVVFTANQKAFLAMREMDDGQGHGIARLDESGAEFAGEWDTFRAGLPATGAKPHMVSADTAGAERPQLNVLEIEGAEGQTSVWIARGFKEIGEARDGDASVVVVTDRAKALELAAKAGAATARQSDIDAAADALPVGLAVSFMEEDITEPAQIARVGAEQAVAKYADMYN